jgi:hypothetical protein
MKGELLSFPFIYFSESGLFNGLQPIQIKKFSSVSNSPAGRFVRPDGRAAPEARTKPTNRNICSMDSDFWKGNVRACRQHTICPV